MRRATPFPLGLLLAAAAAQTAAVGEPIRGEQVYACCVACHALAYDRTGPRHCGLFGRRAGTVPGYEYSEAMRRSGIVWTAAALDRFLAAPTKVVPGTTMGCAGVSDPAERAALIEWLRAASEDGKTCRKNR